MTSNYDSESTKSTGGSSGASTGSNSSVLFSLLRETIIVSLDSENQKLDFEPVEAPDEPPVDFVDSES